MSLIRTENEHMYVKYAENAPDICKMLEVYGEGAMSRTRNFLGELKDFRTEGKTLQTPFPPKRH
jgi:hypothetical protein